MEIVRSNTVSVKIYGQEFNLARPKAGIFKKFLREVEEIKEGGSSAQSLDMIQDFLAEMGLSKDFSDDMETAHIMQLLDLLKNSWAVEKKS